MPKIGYGYALYTGSPSSRPTDISGLGLWLKADAGVDTTSNSEEFVSEVTLVGAGTAGIDGTYKRNVGGRTQFYKQGGNSIYYNTDLSIWYTGGFEYGNGGDFVSWSVEGGDEPAPGGVNLKYSPITYKVNSWADQSGNKLNMFAGSKQADGQSLPMADTAPYYILSSPYFNGKPSIKFDGLYNFMQTKATTLGNVEFSFFIVSKNYNSNTDNNTDYPDIQSLFCKSNLVNNNSSTFNVVEYNSPNSGNAPYFGTQSQGNTYQQIFFTNSTNTRLYSAGFQDGFGSRLWINGGLIGTNTSYNVTNNTIQPLAIGNASTGWQSARESLYGEVAEVIMYSRYLSNIERQQVEGYLNAKYAIY